jgi:hypothetical protein
VTITSPGAGARVFGPATITATVSDAAGVKSVQFKVDGYDLGAPVTASPYSVSWNTSETSDGWHALTAVADNTSGTESTSDPVTVRVANAAPPSVPVTRHEETEATFGPGWVQRNPNDWLAWSGASAMMSNTPGAQATFAFSGTSVTWIGFAGAAGIARVLVDGNFVSDVDLFARRDENMSRVFTVNGLTSGSHVLTIEVTGNQNPDSAANTVVVDAFDVPAPLVSHLQESDPDIAYTTWWTVSDVSSRPWSGGFAGVSSTAGARATLTFKGTEIRWIGYLGPEAGIAHVYVDGKFARDVDAYSKQSRIQDVLFTATNLAAATPHTLTIEATGQQNSAASGASVVVDAFDVTGSAERFQQTDWAVSYTGTWTNNNNKPWSEGTSLAAYYGNATATFRFLGTGVSWIGFRAARTGSAGVLVDGVRYPDVDTYVPSGEGWQDTVFSVSGLANGAHTLTIEAMGAKNPAATNSYIIVDAFDVQR